MKRYLSLLLILLLSITYNVKADMGPPSIARFELIVSNKDGATCYEQKDNKFVATSKKIAYKQIVYLDLKQSNDYYSILLKNGDLKDGGCVVKLSDLSLKDSTFNLNNEDVSKLNPTYAIVMASGGLNMRKGPSTMYSKITTIPEKAIVKLLYSAGSLWYYGEYDGKAGWITSDNYYLGMDANSILISMNDVDIYSDKGLTKKIGTVPKFTEISNYIIFDRFEGLDAECYINYNGVKGYANLWAFNDKKAGKIKLLKEYKLYDLNDKVIKTLKPGIYDYSIFSDYEEYAFLPKENGIIKPQEVKNGEENAYEIVNYNNDTVKKTSGFIGEGLFGEKVTKLNQESNATNENNKENPNDLIDVNDGKTNELKEELNKQEKLDNETIIIIVLSCIVLILTVIVIILFVNKNKKNTHEAKVSNEDIKEINKEEVKEENVKEE